MAKRSAAMWKGGSHVEHHQVPRPARRRPLQTASQWNGHSQGGCTLTRIACWSSVLNLGIVVDQALDRADRYRSMA